MLKIKGKLTYILKYVNTLKIGAWRRLSDISAESKYR